MLEKNNKEQEFEVLGYKVKFSATSENNTVGASDVINLVNNEIAALKKSGRFLGDGETAVLVALKLASDKLNLDKEYQDNIHKLKSTAIDALHLINEVTPVAN